MNILLISLALQGAFDGPKPTAANASCYSPKIAPDGKKLYFHTMFKADKDYAYQVWRYTIEDKSLSPVGPGRLLSVLPDGQGVIVSRPRGEGDEAVFLNDKGEAGQTFHQAGYKVGSAMLTSKGWLLTGLYKPGGAESMLLLGNVTEKKRPRPLELKGYAPNSPFVTDDGSAVYFKSVKQLGEIGKPFFGLDVASGELKMLHAGQLGGAIDVHSPCLKPGTRLFCYVLGHKPARAVARDLDNWDAAGKDIMPAAEGMQNISVAAGGEVAYDALVPEKPKAGMRVKALWLYVPGQPPRQITNTD